MPELPTGTVTYLFTDIEGSTRLLQELGESYRRVQDDHTAILRKAIAQGDGVEIRTEGDSFFGVFQSATQGMAGAVAAQRELARHDWPHGRPLRVRMGLHTGEGVLGGDDYLGLDVNRAARIAAAAHGGQVLFSEATRVLVEHSLPDGVATRSLGAHRLKDLERPEQLFDLVIDGVPSEFPPPRTLEVPTNLPAELTSFLGRETEIARARELLAGTRLLTLTGPGGTGKTRLSLRVGALAAADAEFPDGVFFVDLSPLSDPELVIPTIAATLGIREEGWERPVGEVLGNHLRDRAVLLILDNFEQVLEASDAVTALLTAAPRLKVLVTSRAPLRVRGGQDLPVAPLRFPDPGELPPLEELGRGEAVALFAQRAAAVAPDFALTDDNARHVAEICARLDGLPLAIELAASRAGVLTPAAMLHRMERSLPLLVGGPRDAPDRQRTLRSAIAWSYDLLGDGERALFRRLATLAGGATVEAATAVCDPGGGLGVDVLEGLSSLVDSSLVRAAHTDSGEVRFDMLQTIREFGLDRLDAEDDRAAVAGRHAEWFLRLAEEAETHFRGPDLDRVLESLWVEGDNLRAALRWAVERDEADIGLRMAGALFRFWHLGGLLSEGRHWVTAVLSLPSAAARTAARARALATAGGIAYWQNDAAGVRSAYEDALAIARELGDRPLEAEGMYNLAFAHGLERDTDGARALFERSRELFEQLGDRRGVADCLWALSLIARMAGDLAPARSHAEESLRLHREVGYAFGLFDSLHMLGRVAYEMEDLDLARSCFVETLEPLGAFSYRTGIAIVLDNLAAQEHKRGRPVRAVRLGGASDALKEAAGGRAPPEFVDLPDPRELARGSLTEERIAAAWEEGRAMDLDEILAYARAEPAADE
jgi:predicted ATPase/class 3 adenylate cyclase